MLESKFIGREAELQQLRDLAIRSKSNHGGTLFIEAASGMGKSTLLKEFEERTQRDPELKDALFINVECDEFSGTENAYQPFKEILATFNESESKIIPKIKEIAPLWLDAIPVMGPLFKASFKTAVVALTSDPALTSGSNTLTNKVVILTQQYVNAILKIASSCRLLVLVISDAQWIDTASCQLLLRLDSASQTNNLMLILTYSPEYMNEQHPLRKVRDKMTVTKATAEMIALSGWSIKEICTYVMATFGETLNPYLSEWLRDLCNGEPWFITQYLILLTHYNVIENVNGKYKFNGQIKYIEGEWQVEGQLKNVLPSKIIDTFLNMRISSLKKEEKEILQLAALQGKRFMSAVLERLLTKQKYEIMETLVYIEEQRQLISRCTDEEWVRRITDVYTFSLRLLQQSIYNKLPPSYRSTNHREIAKILEEILKDILNKNQQPTLQQKLLIQIARHYDLGDEPLLSAHYYLQAAQSNFYNGALKESSDLCQQALEKVRSLPEGIADNDKLRAEIIQLKLTSSEFWRDDESGCGQGTSEKETLVEEVEEAEAAASRTGNMALLARVEYLKGKIFVTTDNLDHAVEVLKKALQIAQATQDSLAEFFIMSELGIHIAGQRTVNSNTNTMLDYGVELQHKAYDLFEKNRLKFEEIKPNIMVDVKVHLCLLKARIGIGEFDRGNYGEAVKWLKDSINELRDLKLHEYLSWPLNLLAQVYTAIGQFVDAEKLLNEAINLGHGRGFSAVRANNLALLGKLYMEWDQLAKAKEPLEEGWNEIQDIEDVSVKPIVSNYRAELLMHPGYEDRDLGEAENILNTIIDEVENRTKHYRSAIVSYSLLGQLAIIKGGDDNISAAVKHSKKAVEYLEEMHTVPLVRTEEVFFNHYCVLKVAGAPQNEAKPYLNKAKDILQHKAESLNNEEYKKAFLNQVPISCKILSTEDI